MWKLSAPDLTGVRVHLDTVLDPEVAGPELNATGGEKDAIEDLYAAYEVALGRPSDNLLGKNLRADVRKAIYDAYKHVQGNGRLSALRDTLKLGAVECPYCGFGEIQDLDHHLPKAVFKPLSIFPLNLVPCCATCNRTKPRKPSAVPEEQLLNSYLEDPTVSEFFVAMVALDPATGALSVEFAVQKAGMSDELVARLENHIGTFKLNDRYGAQANIYLAALEVSLQHAFESGGATAVNAFLWQSAEKSATRFGVNDWRTALLKGLAACAAFCDGGFIKALGRTKPDTNAAPQLAA